MSKIICDNGGEYLIPDRRIAEWNGTGMPPVGTVCLGENSSMQWVPGTIVYIGKDHRDLLAIMQTDTEILYGEIGEFRPIKTAEQIAAEERLKAIDEMLEICNAVPEGESKLAHLYDAGYRKTKGTNQ